MCTSFTITKTALKKQIEIAYSSDSNLSQHSHMVIQNRRPNYQTEFKCIFSKTRQINNSIKYTSSNLTWLNDE